MSGWIHHQQQQNMSNLMTTHDQQYLASSQSHQPLKKKRNLPGNPDPEAEVIALSPKTLLATNRFTCEICNKGFQRDQNLQLHRRGHNLPWKLKQRNSEEIIRKKVYVCPEPTCVHHDPSRALGDLTGIKKHFCRKHGEKKWKCDKCSKSYAVQSDCKAHSKTCGTREYRCDCGTLFSRRDSFITHRAFCDALAEETARSRSTSSSSRNHQVPLLPSSPQPHLNPSSSSYNNNSNSNNLQAQLLKNEISLTSSCSSGLIRQLGVQVPSWLGGPPTGSHHLHHILSHRSPNPNPTTSLGPTTGTSLLPPLPPSNSSHMSATALLQKAAQIGSTLSSRTGSPVLLRTQTQTHHTNPTHHVSATSTTSESDNLSVAVNPQCHVTTMTSHGFFSSPFYFSSTATPDQLGSAASFEEALIINGGVLNPFKKEANLMHDDGAPSRTTDDSSGGSGRTGGGGVGNERLTRDFLSLKSLSHNDILTMAGFGNSHHDQPIRQFQWQA